MRDEFHVEVLADSIANQTRVTTVEATFPRWMLPELNTHRLITRAQFDAELFDILEYELSRNSASSRAIPTEKNIERVIAKPYVPATYNARVKGMGVGAEVDEETREKAEAEWFAAVRSAVRHATALNELGLDKSRVNRILEPFAWHTAILTATELENFYALRCPDGPVPDPSFPAQLEFQQLCILMRDAMNLSEPRKVGKNDWHRPFVNVTQDVAALEDDGHDIDEWSNEEVDRVLNLISGRRLARISFDRHTDTEGAGDSWAKAKDLPDKAHWSPLEHILRPMGKPDIDRYSDLAPKILIPSSEMWSALTEDGIDLDFIDLDKVWCGNVRGWVQFRKTFAYEENAGLTRGAVSKF